MNSTLSELLRQKAFLEAGGGEESTTQKLQAMFDRLNQIAITISALEKQKAEMAKVPTEQLKTAMETKKLMQETTPLGSLMGVQSEEEAQKQIEENKARYAQALQRYEQQKQDFLSQVPEEARPSLSEEEVYNKTKLAPPSFVPITTKREQQLKQLQGVPEEVLALPAKQASESGLLFQRFNKPSNILDRPISQVMPTLTDAQIKETFGAGVTKDTPYRVAKGMGDLKNRQMSLQTTDQLYRVPPEQLNTARQMGIGEFANERQIRLLGVVNPIKPATTEEIKDASNSDVMKNEMDRISELATKTNYAGVGIENYYLNLAGQYSPIDSFKTDPDIVEMYQLINDVSNQMIYLRSGKQINEAEYERLKTTFPNPQLEPEAFKRRLQVFVNVFEDIMKTRSGRMGSAGKRGGELKPETKKEATSKDPLGLFE